MREEWAHDALDDEQLKRFQLSLIDQIGRTFPRRSKNPKTPPRFATRAIHAGQDPDPAERDKDPDGDEPAGQEGPDTAVLDKDEAHQPNAPGLRGL